LRPADLQLDLPWTSFNDGCVDQKINLLWPAKQDNCRTKAWKQSSKHVTVAKTQHSTGKHFKRTDPKPQNWEVVSHTNTRPGTTEELQARSNVFE
jgi:hypothetical protein